MTKEQQLRKEMKAQTKLAKEGADADGRQRSVAKSLNFQTAEEGDTRVDGMCPHFHVQIEVWKDRDEMYRGRKVMAISECNFRGGKYMNMKCGMRSNHAKIFGMCRGEFS